MIFNITRNKVVFKLIFPIILIFVFFSFSKETFAISEESIEIPQREANFMLNSLVDKIAEERINSFATKHSSPEQGAILTLLERTIKTKSFNYLITQAPKEMIMNFIKSGARIAPIALDPSLSNIVKMGTEEAGRYAIDLISRNKLRISGGKLSISYIDYKKILKNENFTYILAYNPQNSEIEIEIYSPRKITPPESRGSFSGYSVLGGGFWDEEAWLKKGNHYLSPFVVKVNGNIEPNQYGGYSWQGRPSITIDFSSSVSFFEFEERLSFWDRIKSGFSKIADIGSSSLNYFLNLFSGESTIISLLKTEENFLDKDKEKEEEEIEEEIKTDKTKAEETKDLKEKTVDLKRVNINTANENDLTRIVHIGPARAREIIKTRPFFSLDELTRIHGIGEKTVFDIKNQGLAYVDEFLKELKPTDEDYDDDSDDGDDPSTRTSTELGRTSSGQDGNDNDYDYDNDNDDDPSTGTSTELGRTSSGQNGDDGDYDYDDDDDNDDDSSKDVVFEIEIKEAETVWSVELSMSSPKVVKTLEIEQLNELFVYSVESEALIEVSKLTHFKDNNEFSNQSNGNNIVIPEAETVWSVELSMSSPKVVKTLEIEQLNELFVYSVKSLITNNLNLNYE